MLTTFASVSDAEHPPLDEHGEAPFPGARRPDRFERLSSSGVELQLYEWGDAHAPPLMMMHGGFDFARTRDVFAAKIADAGWRVVSWDQRGHGNETEARHARRLLTVDLQVVLHVESDGLL